MISTPRKLGSRYTCVLADIPNEINNFTEVKGYVSKVRKTLTKQYAKFPFYKEVGCFIVLLCTKATYQKISPHIKNLLDKTGLHSTVILGISIINIEDFITTSASTWGLFHSGKHFTSICETIETSLKNKEPLSPIY